MEDKKPRILLCSDSTEGILSAVHSAYLSRYGHKYITIELKDSYEPSLFLDAFEVPVDIKKAESVARAVMEKLSMEAWSWVRHASMAAEPGKAQAIYRFLNVGFAAGPQVCQRLANDHVLAVYRLWRQVAREADKLMGFVRFRELESGILFAVIAPKHQQLYLLGEHFSDRFPEENWVIYDELRRMACIHRAGQGFAVANDVPVNPGAINRLSDAEQSFDALWKTFFRHIEISERANPKLQIQMMPKRFWRNLTELKL